MIGGQQVGLARYSYSTQLSLKWQIIGFCVSVQIKQTIYNMFQCLYLSYRQKNCIDLISLVERKRVGQLPIMLNCSFK